MNGLHITFLICTSSLSNQLAVKSEDVRVSPPSVVSNSADNPVTTQDHFHSEMLQKRAQSITVKVISGDSVGSGILIERQGASYLVLTNAHVLQPGVKSSIQTPDGEVYSASQYPATSFNGNDLALLQFRSTNALYPVATLGSSSKLAVGDEVFASGFPFETKKFSEGGFEFTVGQVSLLTNKALDGGYQIGYTNKIKQGMSGGPVLNSAGDVVAINGIHAYPLWGDPYRYKDGSKPCPPMREIMVRSAFAIPIDTFVRQRKEAIDFSRPQTSRH